MNSPGVWSREKLASAPGKEVLACYDEWTEYVNWLDDMKDRATDEVIKARNELLKRLAEIKGGGSDPTPIATERAGE